METEQQQFLAMFIDAVNQVPNEYFKTVYYNMSSLKGLLQHRGTYEGSEFYRHNERIFCYELYHQLRILLDRKREVQEEFLRGASLQGELQKMQIQEFAMKLGLENLSAEHIPDFLVHTPGSEYRQVAVMEVKATPYLSFNSLFEDVKKIAEFLDRYRYEFGLFLAVNILPERVAHFIQSHSDQFLQFEYLSERIFIVVKERAGEETFCRPLSDIINPS